MGAIARIEHGFGRRQPRLPLGMPARLITLERTIGIVLEDMSVDGARIALPEPDDFVVCVLRWIDYHAFADVAWRDHGEVGLRFDKPLAAGTLETTRLYLAERWAELRRDDAALRRC